MLFRTCSFIRVVVDIVKDAARQYRDVIIYLLFAAMPRTRDAVSIVLREAGSSVGAKFSDSKHLWHI